jgi:hypothetical protein
VKEDQRRVRAEVEALKVNVADMAVEWLSVFLGTLGAEISPRGADRLREKIIDELSLKL